MPNQIIWTISPDTHNHITHLTHQLHNRAITEAQWVDEVMRLPGYPLRTKPGPGDELIIRVVSPTRVAVPRAAH